MKNNSRILGFDYGHKRIGVAAGNTITSTSQPLTTIVSTKSGIDWYALETLIAEWKPGKLIIGLPFSMAGEETEMSRHAKKFGKTLNCKTGIDVIYVDERLTSNQADQVIKENTPSGKKIRKKHLSMRDKLAAQLILQTYFEDNQVMNQTEHGPIDINPLIQSMVKQIASDHIDNPMLIGIHTGGIWVAEKLHQMLEQTSGLQTPMGMLDISFYRDDFSRVGFNPEVRSSEFPASIDQSNLILVDDVLYTGRTIRAALNEIFSYGRPASVKLGVLISREGRELPIQADYIGKSLNLQKTQQAKLSKSDGVLSLNIINIGKGR